MSAPHPVWQRIQASAVTRMSADGCTLDFAALGTRCRVLFAPPKAGPAAFVQVALRWVADFEATYSRFLPDSLTSRINRAAGREWVPVDPPTEQLLALCQEMFLLTRGVFDPTALPLIQLWDYRTDTPRVPSDDEIAAARRSVGWRKVQRRPGAIHLPEPGMCLDFGGLGKEYAVDSIAGLALEHGIDRVLVDFGADIHARGAAADGRPAWHVGLEDPSSPGRCWAGLAVKDAAVATSGDYLRGFTVGGRRYGHILDVRSGRPVDNGCRAVSVLAPTCTLAGMLSTAAFVLGPVDGLRLIEAQPGAAGCLITAQGHHPSRTFYEHVVSENR